MLRKADFTDRKHDENIIPRFVLDDIIQKEGNLRISPYQRFVKNYINPNTTYSRLLMKWETGTGKTIGSLTLAMDFIRFYKKQTDIDDLNIGSVYIIGFTENIFKNALLKWTEFGFITKTEKQKLNKLRSLAHTGEKFYIDKLREFMTILRKRFTNRKNNGFFKFIGYKALVNRVFIANDTINISELDEEGVYENIKKGNITINEQYLAECNNSLFICDEIHNVYNSAEKNNWGVALQYILNRFNTIRAVFLSATPINNNPAEVIDLLNLILPSNKFEKLEKHDFFTKEGKLKPNASVKLAECFKGRVSFLRNIDPCMMPVKEFQGESIPNFPYLKFIRCPMNKLHYDTYKAEFHGTLSHDKRYILDFIIPNPSNSTIGLYQTNDIKRGLNNASKKWKTKNMINYADNIITGSILHHSNLHKISTKYENMMTNIKNIIKNEQTRGKIFLYHNIIHMSGVLFIQEVLKQNNIIDEYSSSTDQTLCSVCGLPRISHSNYQINPMNIDSLNEITAGESNSSKITAQKNVEQLINIKSYIVDYQEKLSFIFAYDLNYGEILSKDKKNKMEKYIQAKCNEYNIIIEVSSSDADLMYFMKNKYRTFIEIHDDIANQTMIYFICGSNNIYDTIKKKHRRSFIEESKRKVLNRMTGGNAKTLHKISGGNDKIQKDKIQKDKIQKDKIQKDKIQKDKNDENLHFYKPMRFIIVHSNIVKPVINKSIEKFNSISNTNGENYMFLIGSSLIKEAFDFKSIRHIFIMSRPNNIPMLIQIIGRGVRMKSHEYLPPEKQNVSIYIFTSCLPVKYTKKNIEYKLYGGINKFSYEETGYFKKLQQYLIIQTIEKIMHENAVDAYINKNLIHNKTDKNINKVNKTDKNEIGMLPYVPVEQPKNKYEYSLSDLNMNTFNAFHTDYEINEIIIIIKKLFITVSSVWKYKDLLLFVKNPPFKTSFNSSLISNSLFIIAINRLIWTKGSKYIEPVLEYANEQSQTIMDVILNPDDKIIMQSNGHKSVITHMGEYYILLPFNQAKEPVRDVEVTYRLTTPVIVHNIDVEHILDSEISIISYEEKKMRFYNKWNSTPIVKLEAAVCDFGVGFHIKFLEECVKYIFRVWTDSTLKRHELHTFYFKFSIYYDARGLLIWTHTVKDSMFKKYVKFAKPITVTIKEDRKTKIDKFKSLNKSSSGLLNLLKSSINKSGAQWVSSNIQSDFNILLKKSESMFNGINKVDKYTNLKNIPKKIDADLLPIGHFLAQEPRFYHPQEAGWFDNPEYVKSEKKFKENDMIVGYDEKSKIGVHIRFKLRNPIQNIQKFRDTRLIEKGSVCTSKSKTYLVNLAKKLNATLPSKYNVELLCSIIRTKLIYKELKERDSGTNIKWFYFIYERRPETTI
jgi:hypothetical protein